MKNIYNLLLVAGACASLCVPAVYAQKPSDAEKPAKRSFFSFDTMVDAFRTKDGKIDVSNLPEFFMPERVVTAIKKADKDKNGLIDAEEEKVLRALFQDEKKAAGSETRPATTSNAQSNSQTNARGGRPASAAGQSGGAGQGANGRGGMGGPGGPGMGGRGGNGGPGASAQVSPAKKMRSELSKEEKADLEALRVKMIDDGVKRLAKSQGENGSFSASPRAGIGPTLIDAIGLLRVGVKLDEPVLANAMKFLEASVHDDGGVYSEGMHLSSYESCLGLVCFMLANEQAGDGRYDEVVKNAERFVRGSQYNESTGVSREDEYFGGVGYGADSSSRPDLSNTQFFIEALREIGVEEDDQAIQDALVFVSRCQNLESEHNASGQVKTNDGGFIYTFVDGEENPAGQEVSGGLRSYGSITYAGLKSLIYAGLKADDPRVDAATGWIKENYSMEQNPGLGKRGLYYYYHTLSKCFKVIGDETIVDAKGVEHNWRSELIETLALAENADGSWVNEDRMWMETDANLVTGYVLIVLSYCSKE